MSSSTIINDEGKSDVIITPATTACGESCSDAGDRIVKTSTLVHKPVIPRPFKTYMIRHRDTDRYLCILGGSIYIVPWNNEDCGYRWLCVSSSGWLGFQESVTGSYLSKDDGDNFFLPANEDMMYDSQSFQVATYEWDERLDGRVNGNRGVEYHLLKLDADNEMKRIGIEAGFKKNPLILVDSVEEAAAWEFYEVGTHEVQAEAE